MSQVNTTGATQMGLALNVNTNIPMEAFQNIFPNIDNTSPYIGAVRLMTNNMNYIGLAMVF